MAVSEELSTSNNRVKYQIYVTQNSQSVANNTSNVTVSVFFYRTNTGYTTYGSGTIYCKIDGITYSASVATSQKITNSGIYLFSKTLDITHNANGTKDLPVTAWISMDTPLSSSEQGFTTPLTTIPRASQPSCVTYPATTEDVGNIGGTFTIHMNRASTDFIHYVYCVWSNKNVAVAYNVTDNCTFTIPMNFCDDIPNSTVGWGTIYVQTYSNGGANYIGQKSVTFKANVPNNVKPTISNIALSEAASGIPSGAGYVKSYSKLRAVTAAAGTYSSTISAYSVSIDNLAYSGQDVTSNVLTNAGTINIVATVTDSRGRTATRTQTVTVNNYSPPIINTFTAERCDQDGTLNEQGEYAKLTYNAEITALNNANAKSFAIKYKKTSESNYTTRTITATGYTVSGNIIISADSGSSYDVMFEAADSFFSGNNAVHKNAPLSTAETIFNIKANGEGFAFFKVSEKNALEFDKDVWVKGGASMFNPETVVNGTDFDDLTTVGWYAQGSNANVTNNLNMPENQAFIMRVEVVGGNLIQRYYRYDGASEWVRWYQSWSPVGWQPWVRSAPANKALYTGDSALGANTTITLNETIAQQYSGISLVFAPYISGEIRNYYVKSFFIPKAHINVANGAGYTFFLNETGFNKVGSKFIYVYSDRLIGVADNTLTGTKSGITFDNGYWRLRHVYGV